MSMKKLYRRGGAGRPRLNGGGARGLGGAWGTMMGLLEGMSGDVADDYEHA